MSETAAATRSFIRIDDARAVLVLAVPSVFAFWTQTSVNIVDTYFFGLLPEPEHTNAQSMHLVALILLWLVGGFFSAIAVGTQALVARRIGEGDLPAAGAVATNSMLVAFVASAIAAALGWLAIPAVFRALHPTNPEYVLLASAYTRWRFVGIVSMVTTSSCKSFFDGTGRTWVHFIAAVVMNIVNLVGCYALIFGNLGMPRLGVGGAGMAAAASSLVGLLVLLGFSLADTDKLGLRIRKAYRLYRPSTLSRALTWSIVKLSVPSGLATAAVMVGFFLFTLIVSRLDAPFVASSRPEAFGAATTIIIQVLSFTFFGCIAFGVATATLVSRRLGQGDSETAERLAWTSVKLGVVACALLGGAEAIWPGWFIALLKGSPTVIAVGASSMRLMGLCGPLVAIGMILMQALFGAGNTVYVMVVELTLHFAVLVPFAFIFGIVLHLGLLGVWMSAGLYALFLAGAMAWKFRKADWKTIRI